MIAGALPNIEWKLLNSTVVELKNDENGASYSIFPFSKIIQKFNSGAYDLGEFHSFLKPSLDKLDFIEHISDQELDPYDEIKKVTLSKSLSGEKFLPSGIFFNDGDRSMCPHNTVRMSVVWFVCKEKLSHMDKTPPQISETRQVQVVRVHEPRACFYFFELHLPEVCSFDEYQTSLQCANLKRTDKERFNAYLEFLNRNATEVNVCSFTSESEEKEKERTYCLDLGFPDPSVFQEMERKLFHINSILNTG